MSKRLLLAAILLSASVLAGRDRVENWLQVRSPHFVILTDSNEKQARKVADQFERMRTVFTKLFPKLQIDPGAPILVMAIKDEKAFRSLEPPAYLAKGQLKLGGLFLRGPEKNYVLLRLDAEGEHPYAVVYHEYTHLLLSKADWMPLWMNEGLAEFYQNTDIGEKEIALGQPSFGDLELLRQNRLLPLPILFTVDAKSPYYHEENKGSIFYAQSWALTYYLEQKDFKENKQSLSDYGQLLAQNVDPVTAATRAFGDLKQLQSALDGLIRQDRFSYFRIPSKTEVDDSTFQIKPLRESDSEAVRADFLAYNSRFTESRALLNHVLQEDKDNVPATETMGFVEFREGHIEEAKKWYAKAVKLDSQSYLAHYYFAAISMNGAVGPDEEAQVENSFRTSIKLNPSFGPSYNALAAFLGQRHRNLDEARMMALNAAQLEPGNLNYRLNYANLLLEMDRGKDAAIVIRKAMHLAKTPEEAASAQTFLDHAEQYVNAQEQSRQVNEQIKADQVVTKTDAKLTLPIPFRREIAPEGPHRFLSGVLIDVKCDNPAMNLSLVSGQKKAALHSGDYFKIEFSALGFTPPSNLNPCRDLEGRSAKVEYIDVGKDAAAWIVSIEMHK